jgi:hypothetical protein
VSCQAVAVPITPPPMTTTSAERGNEPLVENEASIFEGTS